MAPHPLQQLSVHEMEQARDILATEHEGEVFILRQIWLHEPRKAELLKFLELEHSGSRTASSPRPPRQAFIQYDVLGNDKMPHCHESVVDLEKKSRISHEVLGKDVHAPLIL